MPSCQAVKFILCFEELRNLAGTVFPAVSSSFCAFRNLAGTVLPALSFCIELRNLIRCLASNWLNSLALKNLGIW